jgi:hypothetical protein
MSDQIKHILDTDGYETLMGRIREEMNEIDDDCEEDDVLDDDYERMLDELEREAWAAIGVRYP